MSTDAVRAVIDNSPELQNKPLSDDDEIRRLAKLPSLQYERERKAAAEKLRIGVGALDALIKKSPKRGLRDDWPGATGRIRGGATLAGASGRRSALGRRFEDAAQLCCF